MQPHDVIARQRLGAIQERASARVGSSHLRLLLIGEREDAQAQDLVDLGGVEQVARRFGRDLGMVLEDDR